MVSLPRWTQPLPSRRWISSLHVLGPVVELDPDLPVTPGVLGQLDARGDGLPIDHPHRSARFERVEVLLAVRAGHDQRGPLVGDVAGRHDAGPVGARDRGLDPLVAVAADRAHVAPPLVDDAALRSLLGKYHHRRVVAERRRSVRPPTADPARLRGKPRRVVEVLRHRADARAHVRDVAVGEALDLALQAAQLAEGLLDLVQLVLVEAARIALHPLVRVDLDRELAAEVPDAIARGELFPVVAFEHGVEREDLGAPLRLAELLGVDQLGADVGGAGVGACVDLAGTTLAGTEDRARRVASERVDELVGVHHAEVRARG